MKGRNPHVVYLSRKALHILVALHTCAAGSMFVLPSHYRPTRCMSHATLNRVAQLIVERAKAAGLPLEPFTVHDLRRTGSTLLNEGLQRRLDRKVPRARRGALLALGLQQGRVRRATCHMLQEWADMVDAWIDGRTLMPKLLPENVSVPVLSAAL